MKHNLEYGHNKHNAPRCHRQPEGCCHAHLPESKARAQDAQPAGENCGRTATRRADRDAPKEPATVNTKRQFLWKRLAAPVMALALLLGGCSGMAPKAEDQGKGKGAPPAQSVHDFTATSLDGKTIALADYQGKVLLIVNVASKCGFTGQYEGLQKLYEKYQNQGLVILGFPANDFLGQEPGTNDEIQQFCTLNYGVTFPMFAKISVKHRFSY